jgi:hypothetical protein
MLKHCLIVAAALLLVTYTVSAVPLPSEVAEGGAASRVELPAGAADTDIEGDDDLEIDGGDDENLDGGAACKSGASPRIRLTLGYRFARSWRKRIFHRFFRFFQWKVVRTILRRWVRAPLLSLISFAAPDWRATRQFEISMTHARFRYCGGSTNTPEGKDTKCNFGDNAIDTVDTCCKLHDQYFPRSEHGLLSEHALWPLPSALNSAFIWLYFRCCSSMNGETRDKECNKKILACLEATTPSSENKTPRWLMIQAFKTSITFHMVRNRHLSEVF